MSGDCYIKRNVRSNVIESGDCYIKRNVRSNVIDCLCAYNESDIIVPVSDELVLEKGPLVWQKLLDVELKKDTCPQVGREFNGTEEESSKELDSGIIKETTKEEQGPVKELTKNKK